jgi:hypothetical protein
MSSRGWMIYSSHVDSLLKFLDIQRKHWRVAVEQTALASVRAFHYLHKVRFGGLLEPVQPDREPSSISSASDNCNLDNSFQLLSRGWV